MVHQFSHETLILHSTASNTKFEIDVWRYKHPDASKTVYLQGGIHGIELTGIPVVHEFIKEIEDTDYVIVGKEKDKEEKDTEGSENESREDEDGEKCKENKKKNYEHKNSKEDELDITATIWDEEDDMLINIMTTHTKLGKEIEYAMIGKEKEKRK